ncbi:hypothetical protein PAMP_015835 [Pampus punctatissimus]
MNALIQCVLLLASITMCISAVIRIDCKCIKTNNSVDPSRIKDLTRYHPRPYCNKQEIIVLLKDGRERCLNPNVEFIQKTMRQWEIMKKRAAMNTSSLKTPTTAHTREATAE